MSFEAKDLLQEKRRRKVNFLWQKYGAREEECITEIAGVNVEDQEIPESFTSSPRCYGGVGLSENEENILSLPPKFSVYGKVIVTACEAQVEKGLAKLRWTVKREETSNSRNKNRKGSNGNHNGSNSNNNNKKIRKKYSILKHEHLIYAG
jgi:hypothetical protein